MGSVNSCGAYCTWLCFEMMRRCLQMFHKYTKTAKQQSPQVMAHILWQRCTIFLAGESFLYNFNIPGVLWYGCYFERM